MKRNHFFTHLRYIIFFAFVFLGTLPAEAANGFCQRVLFHPAIVKLYFPALSLSQKQATVLNMLSVVERQSEEWLQKSGEDWVKKTAAYLVQDHIKNTQGLNNPAFSYLYSPELSLLAKFATGTKSSLRRDLAIKLLVQLGPPGHEAIAERSKYLRVPTYGVDRPSPQDWETHTAFFERVIETTEELKIYFSYEPRKIIVDALEYLARASFTTRLMERPLQIKILELIPRYLQEDEFFHLYGFPDVSLLRGLVRAEIETRPESKNILVTRRDQHKDSETVLLDLKEHSRLKQTATLICYEGPEISSADLGPRDSWFLKYYNPSMKRGLLVLIKDSFERLNVLTQDTLQIVEENRKRSGSGLYIEMPTHVFSITLDQYTTSSSLHEYETVGEPNGRAAFHQAFQVFFKYDYR